MTPLKAIRKKCLDCMDNQIKEIKKCTVISCPLYPFRLGHNPNRQKKAEVVESDDDNVTPE